MTTRKAAKGVVQPIEKKCKSAANGKNKCKKKTLYAPLQSTVQSVA